MRGDDFPIVFTQKLSRNLCLFYPPSTPKHKNWFVVLLVSTLQSTPFFTGKKNCGAKFSTLSLFLYMYLLHNNSSNSN